MPMESWKNKQTTKNSRFIQGIITFQKTFKECNVILLKTWQKIRQFAFGSGWSALGCIDPNNKKKQM